MMDAEVLHPETDTAAATNTCSLPLKGPIIRSALENSERNLDTSRETVELKNIKKQENSLGRLNHSCSSIYYLLLFPLISSPYLKSHSSEKHLKLSYPCQNAHSEAITPS